MMALIVFPPGLLLAQDDLDDLDEGDDLSLMLDLDGMDKEEVREFADNMLKKPEGYSAEAAMRVISHSNLNDSKRAARLFHAFKRKIKEEDFEVLADSPLLQQGFTDPEVAALMVKLAGLTRHPQARSILLDAFRRGDPAYRAAAAHAIGLYGDRKFLPMLQKVFDQVKGATDSEQHVVLADGLVRGMLHLGDARHLPRLLSETGVAAKLVATTVLQIASGYTPPRTKHFARKRLPGMKARHRSLERDIIEIAPIFPRELAGLITEATNPDVCDVLYRLLPQLLDNKDYATFIPTVRAKCWDLRQLALDLLMDGLAKPEELPAIRKIVVEWYEGEDRVGKTWAVRNCGYLDAAARQRMLMGVLKNGNRWDRIEAAIEIRRKPTEELLAAAKDLAKSTDDADVQLDLGRLLVLHGGN